MYTLADAYRCLVTCAHLVLISIPSSVYDALFLKETKAEDYLARPMARRWFTMRVPAMVLESR